MGWKWIAAGLLAALAVLAVLLWEYSRYRRQVADICRHLALHHEEDSHVEVRTFMRRRELTELCDRLNEGFEDRRRERTAYLAQESRTKELMTDLSHDIRTPLTSLEGYFDLLSEADSDEERRQYADIISGRLHLLRELMEQLFTYAKLENGAYKPDRQEFDCVQSLCETLLSFYEEFRAKGIEPQVSFSQSACLLYGSKTAFVRVVQNILRNALVHSRDRLAVEMTVQEQTVICVFRNPLAEDWAGDIDKVFERFYTADPSRSGHSSGLGLAVARKLTEAVGGSLSAELDAGDFVIRLEWSRL